MPFEKDTNFTAREDILSKIEDIFKLKHRVALTGIGGVGKSHTALEYCYRYRKKNPESSVVWVYSGTATRFQEEYSDIAMTLKLPGWSDKSMEQILTLVRGWLSADDHPGWLMVIDNADFEEGFPSLEKATGTSRPLSEYIPHAHSGQILITSRNKRVARMMVTEADQVINIQPMNTTDAESLIRKKLPAGTDSGKISELVELMHGIPLAIAQATAYISKDEIMSISKYISWFRENDNNRATLLEEDIGARQGDGNTPTTVIKTWECSFEQIKRIKPEAADLLSLMCLLDPSKIPAFLLPGDIKTLQFTEVIRLLIDFSFVSLIKGGAVGQESFQMVDLVQVATKRWLRVKGKIEMWQGKALELLSKHFPNGEYETREHWREGWQKCAVLAPHAEMALRYDIEASETRSQDAIMYRASLMRNYTFYIWRQGQYCTSRRLSRESLKFHEKFLKDDRALILESKALEGLVLNSLGEHSKAVKIHEDVLTERRKILQQPHQDTLKSMNDLGQALRKQGEHKEAKKMFQEALEGRKEILGITHQETLTSMDDLAEVLVDEGAYADAEELFRATLEKKVNTLGTEHPSTLATKERLAEVLADQKKYEEAERIHREVLDLHVSVLGIKHPDTIWSTNGLAAVLLEEEKFEDAEEKFREALDLCREVLPVDNLHTLSVMGNLAYTLEKQKNLPEAEKLYRDAMEGMKKLLMESHPNTRSYMTGLAMTLEGQGKIKEAENMYNEIRLLDAQAASQSLRGLLGGFMCKLIGYIYGT